MFDYQVRWSEEDQEFVATVDEFPSLSFLAPTQKEALDGLRDLVAEVQVDQIMELLVPDPWGQAQPTWSKPCERCGTTIERWRGQGDVTCDHCGAEYNAFGQRLRDDWRGNPSSWDEDVSDMDGYEIQHSEDG